MQISRIPVQQIPDQKVCKEFAAGFIIRDSEVAMKNGLIRSRFNLERMDRSRKCPQCRVSKHTMTSNRVKGSRNSRDSPVLDCTFHDKVWKVGVHRELV